MKKPLLTILFLLLGAVPTYAVLKEQNIKQSLSVLRMELEANNREQQENSLRFEKSRARQKQRLVDLLQASDQTALMLYSQKLDYIFDLTYACHEATDQYNRFSQRTVPFDQWRTSIDIELARYKGLTESLENMPDEMLPDSAARTDRAVCLSLAKEMHATMIERSAQLERAREQYQWIAQKLKKLNDYAELRYNNIRQNIFINGGDSYITILSRFSHYWDEAKKSVTEKYRRNEGSHSEWRGPLILMLFCFVLFYLIIAAAVCFAVIRWFLPRRLETPEFLGKRSCIIMAASVLTFAGVLFVLRTLFLQHNFFLMATGLLMEYAWLLGTILISLLIRLKSTQIKSGYRIYSPIVLVGLIVIVFRIIFIPNELANIVFPSLLLICTLWQWSVIARHNANIPRSDIFYTWISLSFMVLAVAISWYGYTLMAVQVLIWWIMQLTAIQTITCIYDLLKLYRNTHYKNGEDSIRQTWRFDLISKALIPILAVYSLMFSIYFAARVFDLTELCKEKVFFYNFINMDNVASISLAKLSLVVALWFVVRYLIYAGKALYMHNYRVRNGNKKTVMTLGINMMSIIVWGFYTIVTMLILRINNYGIVVAIGGMSTGVGFAMKDTIENLFYGISLMTGRVNIGDVIECDGVRGKVTNINYQSTMVEPVDGSVMAFLNSQLFSKNFKNLTRNHGYELVKIPVGIAYGSDVKQVRRLLQERIEEMDCYDKQMGISVLLDNFGDNSVDLIIVLWVPVLTKLADVSHIKETVYETLNANHIEIPFPQRDIHIIQQ